MTVKGCAAGIFDVKLDGSGVKTGYNAYRPGCDRNSRETVNLGTHILSAGIHTLRFHVTGKSANSNGYRASLDVIELHVP
ncbi:MAG: hypothetical protein ACRDTU_03600 [Micromonosporaceae bacterium]